MANTLKLYRNGAVGFIEWLDRLVLASPNDHCFMDGPSASDPLCLVNVGILSTSREDENRTVVGRVALIRQYRRGCLGANQPGDLAHIFTR